MDEPTSPNDLPATARSAAAPDTVPPNRGDSFVTGGALPTGVVPGVLPSVPGFEILAELGRGGMGIVYKARQVSLDRLVALKVVLHAEHAGSEALARFRKEAHAIARLQHANIVAILDFGEVAGLPYFSLEFCPGGSLDQRLAQGPLEPREAAGLARSLALAVQAAHDRQVIHRDLKPANILMGADGTPKVADFGLARRTDEVGHTSTGQILGTPSYMAPEQARGKTREMGPHTDVYALGAILYECLVGQPPFREDTVVDTIMAVVSRPPDRPRQLRPDVPPALEAICLKCLEKAPAKRPASARDLAEALDAFLEGRPIPAFEGQAAARPELPPVLVSFRPSDSRALSGKLCQRLAREFGSDGVLSDLEGMTRRPGAPALDLDGAVGRCRAAVVVIGKDWLGAAHEADGVPRLYHPDDPVRREVEAALRRGLPVVPVLVGGAALPDAHGLPESLRPLCRRPAIEVRDEPHFDQDAGRVIDELNQLVGDAAREPASRSPESILVEKAGEVVGRDRAFKLIVEQAVKGGNPVVLSGPPGSGKTVTAVEFARMHLPGERHRDIVTIDARREFYELSLADAVGKKYPEEFYRDHEGSSVSALPFRSLQHRAIELLVKHKAVVIIDGPGEASYPRDGAAELNLVRRVVGDLVAKSVLVLVATRDEAGWAEHHPIALQGLGPENARALLQREFLRADPSADAASLADRLGGEEPLTEMLQRGNPGELIAAARRAAEVRPGAATAGPRPGMLTRLAGLVRRGAEQLFGDPVVSRPASAEQSSGPGLMIACVVLLAVATVALIASYNTGSARWERMFFRLAVSEDQIAPLGAASGKKDGLGAGMLVELGRVFFIVVGLVLVVVGWFFRHEASQLVPDAPWSRAGARQLNLRSAFRVVFVGLAVWLAFSTTVHHYHTGPRILWMCNGNPFLQRHIDSADVEETRKLQSLPADHPRKMNAEPPAQGEERYPEYWKQCVLPYWLYFPYSLVMFVVSAPIVLTVCFYAVCSSLWNHLITQPRQMGELPDDATPQEVENRLRYYKQTFVEDMDRYLVLLLTLLSGWAFHEWLDRHNLTELGQEHTTQILGVAVSAWGVLFWVLMLAYQPLFREAAKRIPDGPGHEEFRQRHEPFRFFLGTIRGSLYFWLCLGAGATGALRLVLAAVMG